MKTIATKIVNTVSKKGYFNLSTAKKQFGKQYTTYEALDNSVMRIARNLAYNGTLINDRGTFTASAKLRKSW